MDDDSKQILILRIVVASLVVLAIIIFIIIIFAIKNGNKKPEEMDVTTRRTLSEEVSEEVSSSSEITTESTTTSVETTTSTTTTTTTTTTKNNTRRTQNSGGGSSSSGGGSSSSGGDSSSNIPTYTYTIIGQNDASSYSNADNSMEWQLVNKINSNRSNKYKVASELRTAAERIADVCCEEPSSCKNATEELVDNEYQLTFKVYYDETGRYNLDYFYNNIVNSTLLNNKYSYLGVGVYRRSSLLTCAAWIVDYD